MARKKMHFEISERKILLRFFDAALLMTGLYLLHFLFDNRYYILDLAYFYRPILLIAYIFIFGVIFEMYNLQVSSNQVQIVRSVVLTATASVILYLFTPVLSPELPKKRLVILVFYFVILSILLVWRFFYAFFFSLAPFFSKCGFNMR